MGTKLCRIHGRSEIAFVCPHIQKLVDSGSKVNDFLELKFDLADAGIAIPYNFCLTCTENYELPLTTEVLSDAASDKYKQALDTTQPVCESCLAEAKEPNLAPKSIVRDRLKLLIMLKLCQSFRSRNHN